MLIGEGTRRALDMLEQHTSVGECGVVKRHAKTDVNRAMTRVVCWYQQIVNGRQAGRGTCLSTTC